MNTQLSFDLSHPVSHRHDPVTSKDAEAMVTVSGVRKSHNQCVAWLVARYPDMTASELTEKAMDHYSEFRRMGFDKAIIEVRRRLSDMSDIHVERTQTGRIGKLPTKECTWRTKVSGPSDQVIGVERRGA